MSDYKKELITTVYPENPEIRVADDPLHKDARAVIERLRAEVAEAKEQVGDLIDDAAAGDPKDRVWVLVPLAELAAKDKRIEDANNHHVEMQRHRDAWRKYAYGRGERPQDFLDGNMVPSDRGLTRIEELERILDDTIGIDNISFTTEQIDAAWKWNVLEIMAELSIVACEECGGSGRTVGLGCLWCHCHGWRIK